MASSKRPLGKVGTRVLLENDQVRIWELELAPGQSSDWHHHVLDYITVALTESKMRRELEDGTGDETNSTVGVVRYAEKHQPHVVTNIGTAQHRNILVELK